MPRLLGEDGLIADDVGYWAREKHQYLTRYIETARATRKRYLPPQGQGGATFIDLFCGTGRSQIRETGLWIDGSAVAAWRASHIGGAAFSHVIVVDQDAEALSACKTRLEKLGAPVTAYCCSASEAMAQIGQTPTPHGLNLAFIDPYSIDLDFEIIKSLAEVKRMDLMIHINQMDFQRNLKSYITTSDPRLERFVPGWQQHVDRHGSQSALEQRFLEYWSKLVKEAGKQTTTKWKLVTGSTNQPLYWLLLAASHDLAHKFWESTTAQRQSELDF
jgi:three-Cys-motif partner protein